MQAARTHVVKNLRHPLQMSPVPLSLLDANVHHHFATSYTDITGYTMALSVHTNHLLTFHVPQKVCNFLGFKARPVFQVGHRAQLPELCSFCVYASNHNHEQYIPFILHINSCWNFRVQHVERLFFIYPCIIILLLLKNVT